ncbi:MAG: guanylate kinase, partial [Flavobacteriaceae bacterium]|nr:guanylate kinase [Flavobacteriaceae bacterium]
IEKESKFDLSIINDDLDLAKKESLDAVQNFLSK